MWRRTTNRGKDKNIPISKPPVEDSDFWNVNSSDYQYYMTIVAALQTNRKMDDQLKNKLAAFSKNEVAA